MIHVIDRVKTHFHNDLVASPEAHGWVLNLYRGGERYPQRVCDYFQSEFAPNKDLARALMAHAGDEDQHVLRFTHALQLRGQPVVEIEWCSEDALTFPLCISASMPSPSSRMDRRI